MAFLPSPKGNGFPRLVNFMKDKLKVKVCGLLRYNSFSDLFKDFDISILADKSMTKKELLDVLQEFYTPEEQKKYGILGIRIEKL